MAVAAVKAVIDNAKICKNQLQDKIIERYYPLDNIKELLDLCDIMYVYDNKKTSKRIVRKRKERGDVNIP